MHSYFYRRHTVNTKISDFQNFTQTFLHNYLYFSGALTTFSIERQSKLEKKEKEGRGKMDALEKPNWWEIEKYNKEKTVNLKGYFL